MTRADQRVAILGDIQGRLDVLEDTLALVGVSQNCDWPEDLVVVQVGDLVHRGPSSPAVIALVDRLLEHSGGRWVQLIGNHEATYLPGGRWHVPGDEHLPAETVATIRRWQERGALQLAVATEDVLVTHAGLTHRRWDALGRPASARDAAAALNAELADDPAAAFRPGWMLAGEPSADSDPGVIWTHTTRELYPGWMRAERVPFGQVHGHLSAFKWNRGLWEHTTPTELRRTATIDRVARHLTVLIDGQPFTGVDPGLGQYSTRGLVPFVLDGSHSSDHHVPADVLRMLSDRAALAGDDVAAGLEDLRSGRRTTLTPAKLDQLFPPNGTRLRNST